VPIEMIENFRRDCWEVHRDYWGVSREINRACLERLLWSAQKEPGECREHIQLRRAGPANMSISIQGKAHPEYLKRLLGSANREC